MSVPECVPVEREFGPDFESVLREHIQVEALRNTAPYSSYQIGHDEAQSVRIYTQGLEVGRMRHFLLQVP